MYRLYIDEVGTDDLTHVQDDRDRYLSLTGVATLVTHSSSYLAPSMAAIKSAVFRPEFDDPPVVLHRSDIVNFKGPFEALRNEAKKDLFDRSILKLMRVTEYSVITALIDKQWMLRQHHWQKTHPYHYLMEILLEKYVQFLERKKAVGDIMPESRSSKDKFLQRAYNDIRATGTPFVQDVARINRAVPGRSLKFRDKKANIPGLQLCDLLAHPSHIEVRRRMGHPVIPGLFAAKVAKILEDQKYDRAAGSGKIIGYGIKHLPQ
jgi:hypothetical protein